MLCVVELLPVVFCVMCVSLVESLHCWLIGLMSITVSPCGDFSCVARRPGQPQADRGAQGAWPLADGHEGRPTKHVGGIKAQVPDARREEHAGKAWSFGPVALQLERGTASARISSICCRHSIGTRRLCYTQRQRALADCSALRPTPRRAGAAQDVRPWRPGHHRARRRPLRRRGNNDTRGKRT